MRDSPNIHYYFCNNICGADTIWARSKSLETQNLLNPNSYQNIDSMLQISKPNLQIGEEKEWDPLGRDGILHCLNSRIAGRNPFKYD